jgi:AraC-like DNA-binding protein
MLDGIEDPLSSVVTLLKPAMSISKMVEASGPWQVERHDMASPFYCAIVEGVALIPDLHGFRMTGEVPPEPKLPGQPLEIGPGRVRLGPADAAVDMRALVGHCRFDTPASGLLVSLLPEMIHVSRHDRLMALVPVIHEETRANRPGRDLILARLLEVLLIEALRSGPAVNMPPGLLRGLADPQQAGEEISVARLAREAGMSRSGFFEKFRKEIGRAPKEYVAVWRMAIAKTLLQQGKLSITEIALRVGYGSASAFGMAFIRHEGLSPGAFAGKQGR